MAEKRAKLSAEDRIVWERVTRTVTPMSGHGRIEAAVESMDELFEPQSRPAETPSLVPSAGRPVRTESKTGTARLHPIERPTLRKIRSGRIVIDARIDLHGLRRAEAHNQLHSFLARAREKGLRHVLVITGKGRSGSSEGVLRREVPIWLSKPEFRMLVSGIETSAHGHGGEGAFYVRLRREKERPA